MERFSRLIQLIGSESYGRLKGMRAAVIGLGAVGSYAVEALVRCGVGSMVIADFDVIARSNINRHIGALESTVGLPKTEVIKNRINDINPDCIVEEHRLFAHRDNFRIILRKKPDILIDAIDSLGPKIELLSYARSNGIKTVSSMGAALRTDPSCIRTADISKTDVCPLARNLRKYLRRRGIYDGITCIYSVEIPQKQGIIPPDEDEKASFIRGRERNILGSYPVVTAMFGLMAADAAIKKMEAI